jgi:retron-type reverse transcriptase
MFAAEVLNIELGGPDVRFGFGVPLGKPLSPLLCNIYLDRLDKFLLGLTDQFDVGAQLKRKQPVIRAGWVPKRLFARFLDLYPA